MLLGLLATALLLATPPTVAPQTPSPEAPVTGWAAESELPLTGYQLGLRLRARMLERRRKIWWGVFGGSMALVGVFGMMFVPVGNCYEADPDEFCEAPGRLFTAFGLGVVGAIGTTAGSIGLAVNAGRRKRMRILLNDAELTLAPGGLRLRF